VDLARDIQVDLARDIQVDLARDILVDLARDILVDLARDILVDLARDLVGLGCRLLDLPVVGDMLHRPITADIGLIPLIVGAGFGPGFGCHRRSITGLGRRHHPITGTNLTGTNLITATNLSRRPNPITGANLSRRRLSTVGIVDNPSCHLEG